MHILIIGSGIVGLTSAYQLLEKGFSVTLIDKEKEPCLGTSFQNGGQLSYSHSFAINHIVNIPILCKMIFKSNYQMNLRISMFLKYFNWFRTLEKNYKAKYNSDLYDFANKSKKELNRLANKIGYTKLHNSSTVQIYRNKEHYKKVESFVKNQNLQEYHILTKLELSKIYPDINLDTIIGAILFKGDQSADARDFAIKLFNKCKKYDGFKYLATEKPTAFIKERNKITAVTLKENKRIFFDKVIFATGASHEDLFSLCSLKSPLIEARGYSLNVNNQKLKYPVIDCDRKLVFTNLNNQVRVAGLYDFLGYSKYKLAKRKRVFIKTIIGTKLLKAFPDSEIWHGFRPVSRDGYPIIGQSTIYHNLYYNLAHANLGWTLAAGSGKILLEEILEKGDNKNNFIKANRFNI